MRSQAHPSLRLLVTVTAGAALSLVSGSAFAQRCEPEPKGEVVATQLEAAKKSMAAGVTFLQDSDGARYEEAYPLFKRAYQLSGSVNALQNMALSAAKLELDGEAMDCFRRYLTKRGATIAPDDKAQVEKDLRLLEQGSGTVTITTDLSNATLVDTRKPRRGADVRNRYALGTLPVQLVVHVGEHTFVVSLAGYPDQTWSVDVKTGDKLKKDFLFEAAKPLVGTGQAGVGAGSDGGDGSSMGASKRHLPTAVWVVGGLTVLSGISWGITGGLALSKKSDYDAANTPESAAAGVDLTAQQGTVKTFNGVTDGLMGLTIAGAATTLVLGLKAGGTPPRVNTGAFGGTWTLVPYASGGGAGAFVAGHF